ncbi:UNVERIFIED_CONTAM: hypothetical protein GTU68_002715, partial [Idotea baltica]|nr:hypothetical protein [Idotea baltica]
MEDFSPKKIVNDYKKNGASAVSVLCNTRYFQGKYADMQEAAENTSLPILCKDFIISSYQIQKARKHGADAILLMASVLSPQQIQSFLEEAKQLEMDALVEVHTAQELEAVLKETTADIIGINNRDLHTLNIDLKTTKKLLDTIPKARPIVKICGVKDQEILDHCEELGVDMIGLNFVEGRHRCISIEIAQ